MKLYYIFDEFINSINLNFPPDNIEMMPSLEYILIISVLKLEFHSIVPSGILMIELFYIFSVSEIPNS